MPLRRFASRLKHKLIPVDLIREALREVRDLKARFEMTDRRVRALQEAVGRVELRQVEDRPGGDLASKEFRVFSQWGEDGIIQHLVREVPIARKVFVEFGVETFEQANARFLMINDNWSGLVIECDPRAAAEIRRSREYWLYNLKVAEAFVTRDSINRILREHGVTGPIGLLSIDVDGVDYWIWEAVEAVEPAIVVVEYNHRFGPTEAVTVPYREDFDRRRAHHSLLYYGASLGALCLLAERKGYDFVGTNRHGLNAFFVRKELRPASVPALSAAEGYREGLFCEAHDERGRRIKMSNEDQARLVMGLPLVRVDGTAEGTAR